MRLADFIDTNHGPILGEWVTFARSQPGAEGMNLTALRDHAAAMLRVIAVDLRTPQSARQQMAKSRGEEPPSNDAVNTAAEDHGLGRAASGFTVSEMMAEFRALRASVLRLWVNSTGALTSDAMEDLMRFNEAIDQALAESAAQYTDTIEQSQDMFMAILGHDLRTPLQTVSLVTEHVLSANLLAENDLALMARAVRSTQRMSRMLDDLLDFTRCRMGAGISVAPRAIDLAVVVRHAVDEMHSISPHHVFELHVVGDLRGEWDDLRLAQVLTNLFGNAIQHGDVSAPVRVSAQGFEHEVTIEVHNHGPAIGAQEMRALFSPFKRLRRGADAGDGHHLGLGLYIVDQIITAHGGQLDVTSTDADGTCFTARLPRQSPNQVASIA